MTGPAAPATAADHPDHRRSRCLLLILPSGCAAVQAVTHPNRNVCHESVVLPTGTGWLAWTALTPPGEPCLYWHRDGDTADGSDGSTAMRVEVTLEEPLPVLALGPRTLRHPDGRLLVDEVLTLSWGRAQGTVLLADRVEHLAAAPALLVHRTGIVPTDVAPEHPPAALPVRWWWWGTANHPTLTWAASLDRASDGWPLREAARACPAGGAATAMDRVEVAVHFGDGGRVPTEWELQARIRGAGQEHMTARALSQLPAALLGGLGASWPLGTTGRGRSLEYVPPPHPGTLANAHTFTVAQVRTDRDARPGLAVTELMAVGPHEPAGWSGFLTERAAP